MNQTSCANIGLPLQEDTDTHSGYTAAGLVFGLVSAFVVASNTIVILALARSYRREQVTASLVNVSLVKALMTSMAVSDAIIGAFSMPLAIYELFMNGHWQLGPALCTAKQAIDIFLCTVSIYHVTCMTVDRYLAVCRPLLYRRLTLRVSYYMIATSWTIPAALSLVPFLGHSMTGVKDIIRCFQLNDYCAVVFDLTHQVLLLTVSFYIPFLIIYVLYFLIARRIWSAYKRAPRLRAGFSSSGVQPGDGPMSDMSSYEISSDTFQCQQAFNRPECRLPERNPPQNLFVSGIPGSQRQADDDYHAQGYTYSPQKPRSKLLIIQTFLCPCLKDHPGTLSPSVMGNINTNMYTSIFQSGRNCIDQFSESQLNEATVHVGNISSNSSMKVKQNLLQSESLLASATESPKNMTRCGVAAISSNDSPQEDTQLQQGSLTSLRRLQGTSARWTKDKLTGGFGNLRAVRTIGSVVIFFTLCWLPFSIYVLVLSYHNYALPVWPFLVVTWLGYINSALNPLLYCCNRSIRQIILTFLCPSRS